MSGEWSKAKAVQQGPMHGPAHGPGAQPRFEKPKNVGKTLMRLLGTLSGNAAGLAVSLLLIGVSSLAGIYGTWYLKPVINSLTAGVGAAALARSLVVIAVIYVVGALTSYVSSRMMVSIAQSTTNKIRARLFNHLQDMPIGYFDSHTHGELMSRFTNDVENVNMALEQSLSQTVMSLVSVVGTFIMMLVLSPLLTTFVLVMLAVMLYIIKIVGGKSARYFRSQQKSLGELNGFIEEMIEGQKVVKVFNHEDESIEEFMKKNETLRAASTDAQTYAGILMPIIGNLAYIHYAVTAMAGAVLSINGRMDIGTIAAFLQFTRSFSHPVTQIANQVNMLLAALAGAERIFEVMDQEIETDDGKTALVLARRDEDGSLEEIAGDPFENMNAGFAVNAADNAAQNEGSTSGRHAASSVLAWRTDNSDGKQTLTELRGDVRFHDVRFGYIPETTVLNDITLFAKPGQKIAFVGSTGAGKTTITNLINRFYEIGQGTITYDGISIRDIRKSDLRRTLGMVLQDVHLFSGTIRDNIRYGKLTASDEEVVRAAKIANAHSFIMRLPNGYDTVLSPDGVNLSQGQRQLLSIARAAVADPPVLILDEATSSIDTRTEALIERGMDALMHGRTTFVIAHRLSTVRNANAIMVLEHGDIIERGDHKDLLELRGRYYQLCTGIAELS